MTNERDLDTIERELLLELAGHRKRDEEDPHLKDVAELASRAMEEARARLTEKGLLEEDAKLSTDGVRLANTLNYPGIEQVEFPSASEFLKYLDPAQPHWGTGPDISWIFRGHGDARWYLQPSAWRGDGRALLRPSYEEIRRQYPPSGTARPSRYWEAAEWLLVNEFADTADALGLRVPGFVDLPLLRDVVFGDQRIWPNETSALAQHHGIPTSLLDFTWDGAVAAYFAAVQAREISEDFERCEPEDWQFAPRHLAVWALNIEEIPKGGLSVHRDIGLPLEHVELQIVPRADNSYLHAQSGLFLWYPVGPNLFDAYGRWPRLEDVIGSRRRHGSKPLRKLVVPFDQAAAIEQILWRRRITKAHLMPTFASVAEITMSKRRLFGTG